MWVVVMLMEFEPPPPHTHTNNDSISPCTHLCMSTHTSCVCTVPPRGAGGAGLDGGRVLQQLSSAEQLLTRQYAEFSRQSSELKTLRMQLAEERAGRARELHQVRCDVWCVWCVMCVLV